MKIQSARFFVYATDLAASLHFYTEVLGLQVVHRVVGGTVVTAGGTELEVLQERRDDEPVLDRRTGFLIFVDDADAAYADVSERGAVILSEITTASDGARVFYVSDPDGLPIGILSEPQPEQPPAEWLLEEQ